MIGVLLTINHLVALYPEHFIEYNHRKLRSIGGMRKHGFPAENFSNPQSIQSPHYFLIIPYLDGVCQSQIMEVLIRNFHFRSDPGSFLPWPGRVLTLVDYKIKMSIDRHAENGVIEVPPHRFGHMDLTCFEDKAFRRKPPHKGIACAVPWENAKPVRQNNKIRTQIASYGQETGLICCKRVWEIQRKA